MAKKDVIILALLIIFWISKPIPYQDVVDNRNQFVKQEILSLRAGDADWSETTFIQPNTGSRISKRTSSQQNPQPKPKDPTNANTGQKVTYQQPSDPGGLGAGNNYEDSQEIPDMKDTISDPEFWNSFEDSEDELSPTEAPVSSSPTYKLTKTSIQENNFLTKPIHPIEFQDWEGESRILKSKEVMKSVFSHGMEAGRRTPEDLAECAYFHKNGKYWTYKKYTKNGVNDRKISPTVKWATKYPNRKPEL